MAAGIEADVIGVELVDSKLVRGFVAVGEKEPSAVVAGGDVAVFLEAFASLYGAALSQGHRGILSRLVAAALWT